MPAESNKLNLDKRLGELKTILRSLLIAKGSRDVTVPQLNGLYREMEERNIPFRDFNCMSLIDFLHTIPDTVRLKYNRNNELCVYHIDTEKSVHISNLVAKQKKPPRKSKTTHAYRTRENYYFNKPSRTQYNLNSASRNVTSRNSTFRNSVSHKYTSQNPIPCNPVESSNPSAMTVLKILEQLNISDKGIKKADVLVKVRETLGNNTLYTLQNLKTHLYTLSHKLIVEDDYIYFKKGHNIQDTRSSLNVPKVVQPTVSNNDIEVVIESKNDFHENNNSFNENHQSVEKVSVINERTKFRLQKLIENHPEGIWCSDIPNLYKSEYNLDLDYHDHGFNNISEFVGALPEIFKIVYPTNDNLMMVLNAKENNVDSTKKFQRKTIASCYDFDNYIPSDSEPLPIKLSSGVSKTLIPDGVMSLNENVDQINLMSLICEEYIEVNISEIFTPSFFWITLRKNNKKIKSMMADLSEFYLRQDLDKYKIPQVVLEVGLNVACVYSDMWHRAMIKKMKPDGYVIVWFYDYGTVKTYHPKDIYFLSKRFSTLPAQAIACSLHNVRPKGSNEWPNESTNRFVNKVWNIPMVAIVSSINEENNTITVTLTDTSDDINDLHISDWMVENELAEWGKTVYGVPIDTLCKHDEIELLKLKEEDYDYQFKNKKLISNVDKNSFCLKNEDTSEIRGISNLPLDTTDSAYMNIATLVKENITIAKQTNTITQAIIMNMSVNKFLNKPEVSNHHGLGVKNMIDSRVLENSFVPNLYSFNNKANADCNSSIPNDNENIFETNNNYLESKLTHSRFENLNHNSTSKYNHSLSGQSVFSCTSEYDNKIEQHNDKQSVHSDILNSDYQSVYGESQHEGFIDKPISLFNQKKNTNNVPELNHIDIKYPVQFAESYFNKSIKNDNLINAVDSENLSSNLKYVEEVDEGYTTRPVSQSNSNLSSTSNSTPTNVPIYFAISLSKRCEEKTIHVFHIDNEGWVYLTEIIDAFTNLRDIRVVTKLLEILEYDVNLKYLTRDSDTKIFCQLDESTLQVPRDKNNKIMSDFVLTLMTIKSMLQVLELFEFLDSKTFQKAYEFIKQEKECIEQVLYKRYNNKILFDVLNLVINYKRFKKSHKL